MKRALSLIIVLAMVLCMIPFSAFAANADIELAEGDFVDGVITLAAGEEKTYLYKAAEAGTLYIYAEAVIPVDENGEVIEDATVAEPYILVDSDDYSENYAETGISVEAGKSYAITIGNDAMNSGDVTVRTDFKGEPGTETNPIKINRPAMGNVTIELQPEVVTWYELVGYANEEVVITGAGVKVSKDGTIHGGPDATEAKIQFANNEMYGKLSIVNKTAETQTYEISTTVKEGTMDNPRVVPAGTYTMDFTAGADAYYYKYIAEGDGTVSVAITATKTVVNAETNEESVVDAGWMYCVNNLTAKDYGDNHWHNDDPVVNPEVITVSEGDEIVINVSTWDWDTYGSIAGTVTTNIIFTAASEEPEGPVAITLPWSETLSTDSSLDKNFECTVDQNGWIEITATVGGVAGILIDDVQYYDYLKYGENTRFVEVVAGQKLTINAMAWSAGDYTFSANYVDALPEADGSSADFALDIGSIIPDGWSYTNETENIVYYTYKVEKTGTLNVNDSSSWWGEYTNSVTKGDDYPFAVEPGNSWAMSYAPAAAMIGEAEYDSLSTALNAAVEGDTIVLCADAESYAGIVLPAGVNLDLGTYDLVAPYLVAFSGSNVIGDVAESSITASNLVADNVTISDVEYAWTAGEDGAYTLVEYKAPVVEDEEPIVAEFGGDQMSLSAALAAAAASAPTANNRAVVTLIANAEVDYNVIIDPYVTLNIAGYTLTAPNVIGLTDSMINAAAPSDDACATGGKIYVPSSKNMVMSAEVHAGANAGYSLLPVWWEDHYLFTQVKFSTDAFSTTDGDAVNIDLKNGWTGKVKNKILNDQDGDVSENALAFVVQAGWLDGPLKVEQKYYFTENSTNNATNGAMYGGGSTGASIVADYWMQALVVSDCGATVYGAKHILNDYL